MTRQSVDYGRPPSVGMVLGVDDGCTAMGFLEIIDGLLGETLSPEAAIAALENVARDDNQKTQKKLLDSGFEIISEYLYRNLKEAAETALVVGKKRCGTDDIVNDLRKSLKNAKAGAHLDGDTTTLQNLNFKEYETFLANVEARHAIATGAIAVLVRCLQQKIGGEPITEYCIGDIFRCLCTKLEEEQNGERIGSTAKYLFQAHIVDMVTTLLLGDPKSTDHSVHICSPFHPGVQMFGARLVGLLMEAAQCDEAAVAKATKSIAILTTSSKWKANPKKSSFSKDKGKCLHLLYRLLEIRLEQSEHAAIWSVLKVIQKLCSEHKICEELLLHGLLPKLDKLAEYYNSVKELGGPKYAEAHVVTRSTEKPAFILPATVRPKVVEDPVVEEVERPVLKKYTLASDALKRGNDDPRLKSLLYLMGEDYVDTYAYRELCDRNMMLLLIKNVRMRCEKQRQSLVAPWKSTMPGKI